MAPFMQQPVNTFSCRTAILRPASQACLLCAGQLDIAGTKAPYRWYGWAHLGLDRGSEVRTDQNQNRDEGEIFGTGPMGVPDAACVDCISNTETCKPSDLLEAAGTGQASLRYRLDLIGVRWRSLNLGDCRARNRVSERLPYIYMSTTYKVHTHTHKCR